jgi:hypothetical protein
MALGARRANVFWLLLGRGLKLALVGATIGLADDCVNLLTH